MAEWEVQWGKRNNSGPNINMIFGARNGNVSYNWAAKNGKGNEQRETSGKREEHAGNF